MTGQQLKNSIFQEAIQGLLVPNVLEPGEKTGAELLMDILAERQRKENEEKGKKAKKHTLSVIEEGPWKLPEEWCWCKLSDIGDFINGDRGKNYPSKEKLHITGEIPFISAINMQNHTLRSDNLLYLNDEQFERLGSGKLRKNDIVICIRGSLGKFCVYSLNIGAIASSLVIFRLINTDILKYVSLFIGSVGFSQQIEEHDNGTAQPNLSAKDVASFYIPLPPLSIQNAIVSKIEALLPLVDEYDKAAVELETLNKTLPEKLRKSVLQEAIHGTLVPNDIPEGEETAQELLQQILKERQEKEDKEKGKRAKKLALSIIEDEPWELPNGWCWCRGKDIFFPMESIKPTSNFVYIDTDAVNNKKNIIDRPKNVLLKEAPSRATRKLHTNDILFSMVRPYLKNIAYVDERFSTAIGTTGFYVITTSPSLYQPYLFKMMLSDYVVSGLTEFMKGDNSPSINNGHIEDFLYPIPPLSVQHRIVEKIEEMFAAINTLQA